MDISWAWENYPADNEQKSFESTGVQIIKLYAADFNAIEIAEQMHISINLVYEFIYNEQMAIADIKDFVHLDVEMWPNKYKNH